MKKYVCVFAWVVLLGCSPDNPGEERNSYEPHDTENNHRNNRPDLSRSPEQSPAPSFLAPLSSPPFSPVDVRHFSAAEVKTLYADLLNKDQQYRDSLHNASHDDWKTSPFWKDIKIADSLNQLILSEVVYTFGWPTVESYGAESVEAAFMILWHAGKAYKRQHLPLLEKAAMSDTLSFHYYKIIQDRLLLGEGREPQYNTHHRLADGTYQILF
jgi:hypothetical protein